MIRIPEDPPQFDLAPVRKPRSCLGCALHDVRFADCPTLRGYSRRGLACHPDNRPDRADVIYAPKKTIFGNEED